MTLVTRATPCSPKQLFTSFLFRALRDDDDDYYVPVTEVTNRNTSVKKKKKNTKDYILTLIRLFVLKLFV